MHMMMKFRPLGAGGDLLVQKRKRLRLMLDIDA